MYVVNKKEYLSIPNILSYFRILLVPIFLYVYYKVETPPLHYISTFIVLVSSLSDFLDGYIARKYNMITNLGKLIDPVADKLTQFAVAIALISTYAAYAWVIAVIIIKDGMLLFFQYYIYKESGQYLDGAQMPGKIATAIFFVVSIILLCFHIPHTLFANILIYCTTIALLMALSYYGRELIGYYYKMKSDE